MKDDNAKRLRSNRVWLSEASCDLDAFRRIVERSVNRADYPFASDVVSNVLVYDGLAARTAAASAWAARTRARDCASVGLSASAPRMRRSSCPAWYTVHHS